jgi:hypothetical protein
MKFARPPRALTPQRAGDDHVFTRSEGLCIVPSIDFHLRALTILAGALLLGALLHGAS